MRKKIPVYLIIIMLIGQIVFPIKTIFAINSNESTDFLITEKDVGKDKKINIEINSSQETDKYIIKLPEKSQLKEDSLELRYQEKLSLSNYSINKSTIEINNVSDLENISFVLTELPNHDEELIFQTYYEGKLIETLKHDIKTNADISNDISTLSDDLISEPLNNSPKLQRDIKVVPVQTSINSGNDAAYRIVLKITGAQVEYENVKLVVDLPNHEHGSFKQKLSELKIDGITPTYNKEKNSLEYQFPKLKSGQTYETLLKVQTENGLFKNNEKLTVSAVLEMLGDSEIPEQKTSGTVTVKATNAMSISKVIVDVSNEQGIARPGGFLKWQIKIAIPKKETGQMYLDPNKKIIVKDFLPKELTYRGDINTNSPIATNSNNTLTWRLDTPSISKQKSSKDYLFVEEIVFWTKIDSDKKLIDKILTNKAEVSGTFIDGVYQNPAAKTSTEFVIRDSTGEIASLDGKVVVPAHYGPLNDKGGIGGKDNENPNPLSDDSAYFGFSHNIWGFRYAYHHPLEELTVSYDIDPNLKLDKIRLMHDDWRNAISNADYDKNIPLTVRPEFDLQVVYERDGKNLYRETLFEDLEYGKTYTRDELRIPEDARVYQIRYVFRDGKIPQGLANNSHTKYYFTVKPGYVGKVENKFNMKGKSTYNPKDGKYNEGKYIRFDHRKDNPDLYDPKGFYTSGDRNAQIRKKNNPSIPISEIGVALLDHTKSLVDPGKNRMKITFKNLESSVNTIDSKLQSMVLLPPGVKLSSSPKPTYSVDSGTSVSGKYEVVDSNYNNSGRQMVKVTWDEKYIRPGEQIEAELNVDISETAPVSLYFDVYGFFGNKDIKVPVSSDPNILNTIKQEDTDDLNGDKNTSRPRIKSGNVYTLTGPYDLQSEKFVRTKNTDWSKFVETSPESTVEYKLYMTNTTGRDLSNITLMDVLPSVGDLGITDNIPRGSSFDLALTGPVKLPKEWNNDVKVFYSTSPTPKRDDLIRFTNYPSGTQKLGNPTGAQNPNWMSEGSVKDWSKIKSFKVEMLPGQTWINGRDMEIIYEMKTPSVDDIEDKSVLNPDVNPLDRAAWNSFAVATDKGQPVEPMRVGVYMDSYIGDLIIKKVDGKTGELLPNAEFEISRVDGKLTYSVKTDDKGIAKLEKIPFGKYEVTEVKAPDGYSLLQKSLFFEVNDENEVVELTIKNFEKAPPLPETGGIGTLIFYAIGGAIMIGGGWMLLSSKRRKIN